jgi:hypothetical protein
MTPTQRHDSIGHAIRTGSAVLLGLVHARERGAPGCRWRYMPEFHLFECGCPDGLLVESVGLFGRAGLYRS